MLRSLFSGISGLRANQTSLDVTGNNIANASTVGFKSSQTVFQDTLSQVLRGASAPTEQGGGSNPAQVGLGVQVAAIRTNFQQGSAQLTNKSTDMMISGDGFFITQRGGQTEYTRAGAFDFDGFGNLVTADGAYVQGWMADIDGTIDPTRPTTALTVQAGQAMAPKVTTEGSFVGNLPADAPDGHVLTRQMDVYNATGVQRTVTVTYTKAAGVNEWAVEITDPDAATTGNLTVQFDGAGRLTAPTGTVGLNGIQYDMTTLTGFANETTLATGQQNGNTAGTLESFTLASDGTIIGTFSNGLKQPLGQVALALFTNPNGLEKAGNSGYRATVNSGNVQIGTAGEGGLGLLAGGALEMSNVDLANEFTQLVISQRGFQASSRVITTSDEVLQELVNLKR